MADSVDELFAIRNLFSLGAYQTIINEVSSSRAPLSDSAKLEAKSYLYRAYIAQGKYNLVISELKDSQIPEQQAVRLLAAYLQAKSKSDNTAREDAVKQVTELLAEGTNAAIPLVQLVAGTVLYNEGLLEDALKVLHRRGKNLEVVSLIVQIYLQIDRLDLARKEVVIAKQWSEDAMLAQLLEAWVDLRIGGDKYKEAFYIFEEFAQSSSANTLKVLNGQAVANIMLARYPEAESLLLEALKINNDDPDTIVNLIVVSNLTSKPADVINRYISQLRDTAPKHTFLQDLELKNSLFDRAAARYAIA